MPAIAYPDTLPEPSVADITAAERRQLTEDSGPRLARANQRDRLAFQQVAWSFDPTQAEAFSTWWIEELLEGGAWFSARWPLPRGWVSATRKFLGAPKWDHIPTDFWRVTAECELRGDGELPQTPVAPSGPWLFFNPGDNSEPLCSSAVGALEAGDPIAFADGVGAVSDSTLGENETNVFGSGLRVPLFSLNAMPLGAAFEWAPADATGIVPQIFVYTPGVDDAWANVTRYIELPGDTSPGDFPGWAGGVLTLFSDNDSTGASGRTVITFLPSSGYYPPVSVEYVA